MKKDTRNGEATALLRSRALRTNMSVSEQHLWRALRGKKLGFQFKRQVPVLSYFLDFYCPEADLCIELDGEQHLLSKGYDTKRDAALLERGIATLRIPSLDLFEQDGVRFARWLRVIAETCEERVRERRQR